MADAFDFEVFDKRVTPLVKRPEVTVQSSGSLSMNKSAFHAMGEPKAVELLYDRTRRVIGFRAVAENAVHAYPIRGFGSGNTYIVSGKAFFAYYEIPVGNPVRREAKMVNGVLVVDLNDPGRDATSNKVRKQRADQRAGEQAAAVQDLAAMAKKLDEPDSETVATVNDTATDIVNEPAPESQNGAPHGLLALGDRPGSELLPGTATGGSTG